MEKKFKWYVNNDKKFKKAAPEWARSVAIDEAGKIFVPAVVWGDEMIAFLSISCDGSIGTLINRNHLYLPIEWIEKEALQQDSIDTCKKIRARLQEALNNEAYH